MLDKTGYGTSQWKKKKAQVPTCKHCLENPGWLESGDKHPLLSLAAPAATTVVVEKLEDLKVTEAAPEVEEVQESEVPKYTKRILKKGDKENFPLRKQVVKVNYTGTLEGGKVFDSSFSEKKKTHVPFTFKVGIGKVIKGWDEAILTMSVGEKCEIVIEPVWAYGKKGAMPHIPPNATLTFEVELVGILG